MDEPRLRRGRFISFVLMVAITFVIILLKIPWPQYIRLLLNYHKMISTYFYGLTGILILFRLYYLRQKEMPEISKFHFLGPRIGHSFELTFVPLFDASLFYSAMFLLFTIFKEGPDGLSPESFIILLFVAGALLFQSISDLLGMGREIFFVQGMGEVNPE